MGLISRVSSRTYRNSLKNMQRTGVGVIRKRAKEAALKNKAVSPLRGFEFVESQQTNLPPNPAVLSDTKRTGGPVPNQEHMFQEGLKPYNSYNSYVREALKAKHRFNSDRTEGWWLKINELQDKTYTIPENEKFRRKPIESRYKNSRSLRSAIEKGLTKATPITESKINCVVDLDELAAVDGMISENISSRNPDESVTGQFLEEQAIGILAFNGIFEGLHKAHIDKFSFAENVDIKYGENSVEFGNEVTPSDSQIPPKIEYFDENGVYTSCLISLDSGIDKQSNYIHYLEHNGKGMIDYIPPFPTRGTGYHRMAFLVFKGLESPDISKIENVCLKKRKNWRHCLSEDYDDKLGCIKFFNSRWDKSVTETFKNCLKMKEPVYEFADWPTEQEAPMTTLSQDNVTIEQVENMMPDEPIYPGGGQPEEYKTSRIWDDFNNGLIRRGKVVDNVCISLL